MQLNPAARELIFRVVYYGPGMSGKTTNMQWLSRNAPPGTASEVVTVDVHSERTLHFDLLASDLGQIQGHNVRIEFHTVPGQSYYAATRRQVLTGADGVVFVADSRREALDENIASMNEMLDSLRQLGMPQDIPVVLQYNKQDLPTAVPREQLDPLMNVRMWPSFAAAATEGRGVEDTARSLLGLLVGAAGQIALPELPTELQPKSWLISCHRCQAMLEVPDASIGAIYTCGVCNSTLEVIDPDRGLTREPVVGRSPLPRQPTPAGGQFTPTGQRQLPQSQAPVQVTGQDDSNYAMKTLPVQQEVASSALQPAVGGGVQLSTGDFPLPGWEVLSFIDESPQGRRLRVRDQTTGRTCRALVLSRPMMALPGYAENLEPYVRLAGPLKHPHILPLLEMRPAGDGAVLLSADAADYEPLSLVLARRRALAPPHAMGILRQVVLALEDAARQGVVHGWIRPEVILISPDGSVMVDEFAVPKNHRFLLRELAGASAATEYYLAPEHLGEDARSDLRSDMFLCGALLYRMITGEGLVTGYNAHEALHRLLASGGRPLRSVGNTVSRDLELFYKKLIAVNRGERFESYRQLVEILDRFGGGAKRQTMRLTQNINAPGAARSGHTSPSGATGTRGTQRPGPGLSVRPGTGQYSNQAKRATGDLRPAPVAKSSGGGALVVVVIIVILAMVAVVGYVVYQNRQIQPVMAPPVSGPVGSPVKAPLPVQQPRPAPTPVVATSPVDVARPVAATPIQGKPSMPAPAEMSVVDRREIITRIADFTLAERWQAALVECEKLPVADNQGQKNQVLGRHEARRQELETLARNAADLAMVRRQLAPALDGTWGMQGDREWARGLLDQAEARLVTAAPAPPTAGPVVETPPAEPPAQVPAPVEPVKPPPLEAPKPAPGAEAPKTLTVEPGADQVGQIFAALAQGQFAAAQGFAAAMPADAADGRAMRLAAAAYPRRAALLDRVAKARATRLRLLHPTTRESVDVAAAAIEGLEVVSPTGSTSVLTWAQLGAHEAGRLLGEAAVVNGTPGDDQVCAVAGLVVGGDNVRATVLLRRIRPTLAPEVAGDLEALVAIGRRGESTLLIARAQDAAKAGQAKALLDCLNELRRPERAAIPAVAAALPRLEAALRELMEGKAAAAKLLDKVAFDAIEDLQQFPELAGTWQVAAGSAGSAGDGRLARRDAASARSVQVIFTQNASRGIVVIEFKGLKASFDLATGQFTTATAPAAVTPPRPCNIVPRAPNILFLDYKEDGNHTTVELNSQVIADVVMGDLSDVFAFAVAGGAVVQVDEVAFTRSAAAAPGRQELRQLGWEVSGLVALDEKRTSVALSGQPNAPAVLSRQTEAGVVGYTLEVKGQGGFRIQLGGAGGWQNADVALPPGGADPMRLTVRWAQGTFVVLDGNGVPMHSAPLARPVTQVSFTAFGSTVVALPIRPNRQ